MIKVIWLFTRKSEEREQFGIQSSPICGLLAAILWPLCSRGCPKSSKSGKKRRRAAMGADVATDILGTGIPKPPPAFPRSKKFSQATPLRTLLAYFVPTPGKTNLGSEALFRFGAWVFFGWRFLSHNPNLNLSCNLKGRVTTRIKIKLNDEALARRQKAQ
jgi:hypothetical protein